jgi:hypothetical protein
MMADQAGLSRGEGRLKGLDIVRGKGAMEPDDMED